jgi:hypothetical protein
VTALYKLFVYAKNFHTMHWLCLDNNHASSHGSSSGTSSSTASSEADKQALSSNSVACLLLPRIICTFI